MACLNELKSQGFYNISFPSIGTRGFGYPSDLSAALSLKSAIAFLDKNKDKKYVVNFVIYEKDNDIIQVYNINFNFSLFVFIYLYIYMVKKRLSKKLF